MSKGADAAKVNGQVRSHPRPWPVVQPGDPVSEAQWRTAVQERLDEVSEDCGRMLSLLEGLVHGRHALPKLLERSLLTIERLGETGQLRWIALVVLGLGLIAAGSSVAITWGDWTLTTGAVP